MHYSLMIKKLFVFVFFGISLSVCGATSDSLKIVTLQREVSNLKTSVSRLQQENGKIRSLFQQQKTEGDSLKMKMGYQEQVTDSIARNFDSELSNTNNMLEGTASQLANISFIYFVIGICCVLLFAGIAFVLHYLLRKKINTSSSAINKIKSAQEGLEQAQKALQAESVKLDNKLMEMLSDKMGAMQKVDHSFALKVGDEIARIETNLSKMDKNVRGYNQLKGALQRIKDNFNAHGYEIVELLGLNYNDGMPFEAQFVPDDTLPEGKRIISGITRLQINYNGEMIQSAKIVVRQNI